MFVTGLPDIRNPPEPEINQLRLAFVTDDDVLWLDIAMQNPAFMGSSHCICNLSQQSRRPDEDR